MGKSYQYCSDMRFRRKTLSPLLRMFAAATLVLFVAGQVVCFAHCHLGGRSGGATQPSCHAKTSHCQGGDPSTPAKHDPMPASTCSTLKNAVPNSDSLTVVAPEFPVLYTLAFVLLTFEATAVDPNVLLLRAAWPAEWVFTPEVSLGPAHRSLAPPVSAC